MSEKVRIIFVDGERMDDVLAFGEELDFEAGWLHIVTFNGIGRRVWLRSYPAATIHSVKLVQIP